jgi:hypothetical protein
MPTDETALIAAIDKIANDIDTLHRRMDAFEVTRARPKNELNENPIIAASDPVEPSRVDAQQALLDGLKARRDSH